MALIGCTVSEIAAVAGVSKDTIERNFAAQLALGRERGKRSLRRMQWKSAKSGNVKMLIWLGKQLLGQSDKVHTVGHQTVTVRDKTVDAIPSEGSDLPPDAQ